jgi:hypothetical protein
MSSRSHAVLFEATRSALLLPCPTGSRVRPPVDLLDFPKSNLDNNFWILRELGRHLVLGDHGVGLPDFGQCPEETPI